MYPCGLRWIIHVESFPAFSLSRTDPVLESRPEVVEPQVGVVLFAKYDPDFSPVEIASCGCLGLRCGDAYGGLRNAKAPEGKHQAQEEVLDDSRH